MIYGKENHILSTKDVETFFHHLVYERKVNFHPDDMFEDYVSCEGGINTFTIDECAIYNRLMDECFRVCDNEGVDIYSIGLKELQTALHILYILLSSDSYIPIMHSGCSIKKL